MLLITIGISLTQILGFWKGRQQASAAYRMMEFSYRTSIDLVPFIAAAMISLSVAAVSIRSAILKVSFANPAHVLRNE